jgi:hypothetical protein
MVSDENKLSRTDGNAVEIQRGGGNICEPKHTSNINFQKQDVQRSAFPTNDTL